MILSVDFRVLKTHVILFFNIVLIENPWFIDAISGGESTINSLRYIMIAIMCLYVFPVLISLVFCKFSYIVDIVFSTFSFVFYSPTYLNILNIYALCRMDDISWGTKGLNSEVSRKKEMVD
jgi:chitin synthase